ncbi:MAG: cysteate synthase [Methanothrix sp.]|nr:MAG: cysteate synthase [Methanothrix sp.]
MGEYRVRCVKDGSEQPHFSLSCPNDDSLLRADYKAKRLDLKDFPGIWRFLDWLPVQGIIPEACQGSVTYRSLGLAGVLGLKNLFISFSGYWPEKGARMTTCSFKDLEAPPTVQRLKEKGGSPTLVVASAGNTARAFAQVASQTGQPLVLFVPEKAQKRIWTTVEPGPVKLVAVQGDYYDAITVAEKVQSRPGYVPEGGARNIARRDGMGTVMLDATLKIGRIPDHYFQAVGSGTGGISAWEACLRLNGDGRFGSNLSRLHLAQNVPNAPIYFAWKCREPDACCADMFDDVLFNRRPPFAIPGGVKDALEATKGEVYGITDNDATAAKRLFEQSEEIDILNAPGVAVAALQQAVSLGTVQSDDIILLNITGGGVERVKEDCTLHHLPPDITIEASHWEDAIEFLEAGA